MELEGFLQGHVSIVEILVRLSAATFLASLLGMEREWHGKPAGLRTYMMVALGSAGFTIVTLEIFHLAMEAMDEPRADPIRIVEGVIGGIGFLGAGSIIRARGSVEGVTTAAGIWVVGAVGIACGAGLYPLAGLVVVFAFLIFTGVGLVENLTFARRHDKKKGEGS